jgi:Reverse transcriptase (RNA-dependent DNA polymerase)
VDFTENYAPVVNDITMHMLVVLMKLHGWKGKIIDVETAFLYGELEEEINMTIPRGLEEYKENNLKDKCVLSKSLYMD